MPPSVATDLLCERGIRQTNRDRKAYQSARVRVFCAVEERQSEEVKLADRYANRTLLQLGRIKNRSEKKRCGLQRRYETVKRLPENPLTLRLLAALDLAAGRLDLMRDAAEAELDFRSRITHGVAEPDLTGSFVEVAEHSSGTLTDWRGQQRAWVVFDPPTAPFMERPRNVRFSRWLAVK